MFFPTLSDYPFSSYCHGGQFSFTAAAFCELANSCMPPLYCEDPSCKLSAFNFCARTVSHLELTCVKSEVVRKFPDCHRFITAVPVSRKHFGFSDMFIENTETVIVGLFSPRFLSFSGFGAKSHAGALSTTCCRFA